MADALPSVPRRGGKSPSAFRTISEVATELNVPQHVLRFWESKFGQVRPLKRGGGRRYYRPEDVELLRTIRGLLYDEGYTIRGVQKLLREGSAKANDNGREQQAPAARAVPEPVGEHLTVGQRAGLRAIIRELEELKSLLIELGKK